MRVLGSRQCAGHKPVALKRRHCLLRRKPLLAAAPPSGFPEESGEDHLPLRLPSTRVYGGAGGLLISKQAPTP